MKTLLLAAVLLAPGCGTIRALVGPDPALVAVAPTINRALDSDSAARPENKPQNDRAKGVLENNVNPPPLDGSGWLALLASLLTPTNIGIASALGTGVVAVLKGRKTEKVVDQHADLIDSVTPEEAEFAAKTKKRKAKASLPA